MSRNDGGGLGIILFLLVLVVAAGYFYVANDHDCLPPDCYYNPLQSKQVPPVVTILSPADYGQYSISDSINFNSTASMEVTEFFWDVGENGKTFMTRNFSYKYTEVGPKTILFRAKNKTEGWSEPVTITITILPASTPQATIIIPENGSSYYANQIVTFTAHATIPVGNIIEYTWNFGDGSSVTSPSATATHIFLSKGNKLIKLRARSDQGTYSPEAQVTIAIIGSAPEVGILAPSENGTFLVGHPIQFQGYYSISQFGTVIGYEWDFGDKTKGYEPVTSHTYAEKGTYIITFKVKSADGTLSDPASVSIALISNSIEAYIVKPNNNSSFALSDSIEFEGYGRLTNGTVIDYAWNFGDGTSSAQAKTKHTYAKKGAYRIEFRAESSDGTWSDPKVVMISIMNAPPEASFTYSPPNNIPADSTVIFTSTSSDKDGDTLTCEWYLNEKKISSKGCTTTYKMAKGTYKMTLYVTDSSGAKDSASTEISVEDEGGKYTGGTTSGETNWVSYLILLGIAAALVWWFYFKDDDKRERTMASLKSSFRR